ncbi:MAG: response regulator transcription factor [Propionibacteriaceae bacterium]|nr:response regulator transcription factor [Propionibacteriaceae bacterium]
MTTRILLVDDDPMVRTGLRFLLDSADDLEVIGEVGDGAEVEASVRANRPDVVLMDLRMPGLDGIDATRLVRALPSPPHVIVLTTWDVDDAVIASLQAGASGFLLKSDPTQDILRAIRSVGSGDAVLSPRSTRHLLDRLSRDQAVDQRRAAERLLAGLTEREREIAREAALGLTNAEIGAKVYLSDATVKSHLSSIQTKLGVHGRVEVAVLVERAGLLRG